MNALLTMILVAAALVPLVLVATRSAEQRKRPIRARVVEALVEADRDPR